MQGLCWSMYMWLMHCSGSAVSCLPPSPPQLLAVSDLFTERNQFEMMYTALTELQKQHPSEDEILVQYLVPAICKAAAVLGMVRWAHTAWGSKSHSGRDVLTAFLIAGLYHLCAAQSISGAVRTIIWQQVRCGGESSRLWEIHNYPCWII